MRDAMGYEYLIRKAYGCGKQSMHGAEADIFRRYEKELRLYELSRNDNEVSVSSLPLDQLAYNAGVECGKVTGHIRSSISKILNENSEELSEEQKEILENCASKLLKPTKEKIKDSIEQANKVFSAIGLKVG